MNERIKELAEQAKQYARDQFAHTMEPGLFSADVFQEKFAELIIQDCVTTIINEGKKIADSLPVVDRSNFTKVAEQVGMANSALSYSVRIKEHFGLK